MTTHDGREVFVTGPDGREPGPPVTLTEVIVDELRERARKAEAELTAWKAATAWYLDGIGDPDGTYAVEEKAKLLLPTEQFLQKVRAL